MEVKKIVEGMTASQVAQVIDDNFKAQNVILEEDIAKQNNVIGVSEYKDFSEAEAVNVGDVRKYNELLYECVEATTGAFDAAKWKATSFKKENEKGLSELTSKTTEVVNRVSVLEYINSYITSSSEGGAIGSTQEDGYSNVLINPKNGNETAYESARASDYIEVKSGVPYYVYASMAFEWALYAFYDSDKKFIIGESSERSITQMKGVLVVAPENAAYIRVCKYGTAQAGIVLSAIFSIDKNLFEEKKWAGKKWVCVGDSLTEKNSRATMNYHDYITELTGIEVFNMGVSGTGYKRQEENGNAFYQRVKSIPTDADVITIFGSGNDGVYWVNQLGTASDTGTETLGGCINTTIDNIYSVQPLAVVGIISPCPWGSYPTDTDNAMKRYSNLLEAICVRRGIPFLNLYINSGLRPWDANFRQLAYSRDDGNSVHPDENGHKLIAPRFKSFLETLIM